MNRIDIGRRVLAAEPDHPHARQVIRPCAVPEGRTERRRSENSSSLVREATTSLVTRTPSAGRRSEAEALAAQRKDFPASAGPHLMPALATKTASSRRSNDMAAEKDPRVGIYLTYPELAFLRNDPRLAAFRRTLNLPPD